MKIGIYTPYLDSFSGGEKYMLTLASCLAQKHDISLFWDPAEEKEMIQKAMQMFAIDLSNIQFKNNIFSHKTSLFARLRESKKYDSIIVLSDGSIPFLLTKLIVHFQTPVEWVDAGNIKTKIKINRVQRVICNSQFTKSFIDKKFGVESTVVYPPVTIQKKEIKKENIILHVGRFGIQHPGSSYKKQEVLADVFSSMVKNGLKDWELIFVMSVRDEHMETFTQFKDRAEQLPVKCILSPNNNALEELYAKAKIYWHASGFGEDIQTHPDRAEHFGISTVEAMSAGAVPIVINAGGQKEIVEDGVNGYLWNSKDELIEKTKEVIDNKKIYESLAEKAQEKAKKFSKEKFCERINEIL